MNIHKMPVFVRKLEKLPKEVRRLYRRQESRFEDNWLNPLLQTKKLKELSGVYSFRITRKYRALFYFKNNLAIFFSIGHRKDIYRKNNFYDW